MQQQKKLDIFWWHPRVMDYRLPLFELAIKHWNVHFFLLGEPGGDFRQRAKVSVATSNVGVTMRPWKISWQDIKALWHGVGNSDAVVTSFLWNGYSLLLLIFCLLKGKPITVWDEKSAFPDSLLGRVQKLYFKILHRFVSAFFLLGVGHDKVLAKLGVAKHKIFAVNEYPGYVYSKVEQSSFQLPGLAREDRVLYLGRLIVVKGIDYLIRAFARVIEGNENRVLLIVGDGPERQNLEALGKELGIGHRIFFLGAINEPSKKSFLFQNCAVMAVPSIVNGNQAEAGPIVVLEALSAGLPLVCSEVGSSNRYVAAEDQRLVVPQRSVPELADALNLVLDDLPKYRRMMTEAFDKLPNHEFQFETLKMSIYLGLRKS